MQLMCSHGVKMVSAIKAGYGQWRCKICKHKIRGRQRDLQRIAIGIEGP